MAKAKKHIKAKSASKKGAKKSLKAKTSNKKSKKVSAIPKGYNNVTPYLIIDGAASAIEFYKKTFGAKEKMRMEHQPGKIGHAELQIGDTKIMLADECHEMNAQGPKKMGGTPVSIHLYIKNVDDVADKAVSLGATLLRPVQNMFYGDRSANIEDPYGHKWCISTHVEDLTPSQIRKRAAEAFAQK